MYEILLKKNLFPKVALRGRVKGGGVKLCAKKTLKSSFLDKSEKISQNFKQTKNFCTIKICMSKLA